MNRLVAGCLLFAGVAVAASCNNASNDGPVATDTASHTGGDTTHHMPAKDSVVAMVSHAEAAITATYADTALTGTAVFDADSAGKVTMKLEIAAAAKAGKSVAVHLHEHGDCSDNGKGAHGHWNPTGAEHGKWGTGSFHSGDIGNVKLDAKGKGSVTITTDLWTLGGAPSKNILGKAVIVHGGVDDYKTQPTGNAGSRIGCGVIK